MLIESSPTNLDPRIGVDAQAEHIDSLLFDALVRRDEHFGLQPLLATSWKTPDPLTWVFHLRTDARFHDGRPLTSRDVKFTIDSILDGTVISVKAGSFTTLDHIDAPDPATVVFHLKKPDPALPFNLCDGAIGIVPCGSGRDFGQHPMGSGPFAFVSQQIDRDVVIARAPAYWGDKPNIPRIRFAVVPDATTRALELEKGSADVESNALPADEVYALRRDPHLAIEDGPGTVLNYIVFNTRDPILRDARVRTAIAVAINRPLIIQALYRGEARLAESIVAAPSTGPGPPTPVNTLQSRRRQRPPRSGRLSPRCPRRPLPRRHENLQRRNRPPHGRRHPGAARPGRHRSRSPQL